MGRSSNEILVSEYDVVDILKKYARENYVNGGHWAVESLEDNDYLQFLPDTGFTFLNASDIKYSKKRLREWWMLAVEQEQDCY